MRVGLLGGTFDPVHNGHLSLAEHAMTGLRLDEMLFVPAGEPWRKGHREITAGEHRLAMLRLAIEGSDAFGICDIELRRPGPTYTADTVEELAGERLDDEFWFVLGADALADIPHWHEPERIVRHAKLGVAARAGEDLMAAVGAVPQFTGRIEVFEMPRVDISSTDVRIWVASGRSVAGMVPPAVEAYIRERGLYRE
ncbi:MAG: nicotinate-nucleotide adenylyltransferase [Dehalococcoidia bacterium]